MSTFIATRFFTHFGHGIDICESSKNLAMEQQRRPHEKDQMLTLATRKCLFRLLSFLDSQLPDFSAVHSFVHAALITANPSYQVYFRQQRFSTTSPTDLEEDDYSLIIGIRLEHCMDVNQQLKKFWNLTAWTLDNEKHEREMASAFEELNMIDWNLDVFTMRYKHHTPSPAVMNFLIEKQRPGLENKHNIPCNQYYLTKEDALSNIKEIDGVYVKSLERCHAQTVYDHWPYKGHTTLDYVSEEIEQLPSAGVFFKGSDQLVSWMMCSPPNGMSRIFTLEEYRHRGYAALVTKYLSKRVAQSGLVPFVNIHIENQASHKFFESVGFKLLGPIHLRVTSHDS
ncbi:uncharacterized protein LOC124343710 isoform X3 [Daphnia pulicaria]|uniref:uncharacterized protein LOC124343710 isoform X3 n=1 Tax=Daphnia pulicaria TaxID=35523 RepID=UPI001EEAFEC8|nr:uncharacterized protein LOC124343710 isoform X3 [Daphnia pulicaria]